MKLKLPASYELAVSRRDSYIAALGRNVACADLRTMKRVGSWHPLSHPSHASFSHAETRLAVKSTSGEIAVIDVADGTVLSSLRDNSLEEGASLHFSASDEYLVDASWAGTIDVRRAETLASTAQFRFPGEMITQASPSADRTTWLFAHQPKTRPGENVPDYPHHGIRRTPVEGNADVDGRHK